MDYLTLIHTEKPETDLPSNTLPETTKVMIFFHLHKMKGEGGARERGIIKVLI